MSVRIVTLVAVCLSSSLSAQAITNTITHSGSYVGGVAYDSVTNEVVVMDAVDNTVTFYDRASGTMAVQFAAPGAGVIGGQIDPSTGRLWLVDEAEVVYQVDRQGNVASSFSARQQLTDASALTLDPAKGTLWISDDSANLVTGRVPEHFEGVTDVDSAAVGVGLGVGELVDGDDPAFDDSLREVFVDWRRTS